MAEGLDLVLAFHNHQPVGNFDNIFREAFERCYDPLLHFVEEHSHMHVCLHYSGCLFDWLEANEKQHLKRLERLVRSHQVEMLGGGYYEPILPLIPERDADRQLRFMNNYLKKRFNQSPQGFWLTERVWEPKLPRITSDAGLRFTAVDDTHFSLAGFSEDEIHDYFVTEEEGRLLYVFPIPKYLRYAIPFHEPHETIEFLQRQKSRQAERPVVAYADDGEKLGLWPGTYQWVYRDGWLERFANALEENKSWLTLKTFSEVLEERKDKPVPKAYLPTASYEEMMEWSLGREKSKEFQKLKKELEDNGLWARARNFCQTGNFKNFYTKYSEADWMRTRMKWVSTEIEKVKDKDAQARAERELWQAQCNCPYWHGVFGGLYLHHLRRSTYKHLLQAEKINLKKDAAIQITEEDVNLDGAKEIILRTEQLQIFALPHRGGAIAELDFLPTSMNVLDTLTRRKEIYHDDLVSSSGSTGSQGKSIHDMQKTVTPEVMERVAFDEYERYSFIEHFLAPGTGFQDFWKGRFTRLGTDLTRVDYAAKWKKGKTQGVLTFLGRLMLGEGQIMDLEKKIQVKGGDVNVSFKITNRSKNNMKFLFGSEWNFNFYAHERIETDIRRTDLQDGWSAVHLEILGEKPFDFWQFPIETLAQTEKDFRLIHQGMSVFPHWKVLLPAGETFQRSLAFFFSTTR